MYTHVPNDTVNYTMEHHNKHSSNSHMQVLSHNPQSINGTSHKITRGTPAEIHHPEMPPAAWKSIPTQVFLILRADSSS